MSSIALGNLKAMLGVGVTTNSTNSTDNSSDNINKSISSNPPSVNNVSNQSYKIGDAASRGTELKRQHEERQRGGKGGGRGRERGNGEGGGIHLSLIS